jgi:hypothetical protein
MSAAPNAAACSRPSITPPAHKEAAKQLSFRLPEGLIDRVERCTEDLQAEGLEVTRADVVRLLLRHAWTQPNASSNSSSVERLPRGVLAGGRSNAARRHELSRKCGH